jgi:UDP-2,3-diacylglucosamine pyrophosphatase LpxH
MKKIKSLFISDIHLGNPNSRADKVLELLKMYNFKNLFIVGDFIDITYMKRKKNDWNKDHLTVIQKVLRLSRKGVKIIYVVGNHDAYIRKFIENSGIHFGDILICNEYKYKTSTQQIYITHGDEFDGFIRIHPFIYWLGDNAYELSIKINKIYNTFRKMFGLKYWSLSSYLKNKVKNSISFINEYEKMSKIKTQEMNCDSILMGHTHHPKIETGYYNTGDFVESCSYIIEDYDEKLILHFI